MDRQFKPTNPLLMPFECVLHDAERGIPLPISVHWQYFAEIILVKSGVLKVLRGNTSYLLRAGEMLFIPPLLLHSLENADEEQPIAYEVIRMDMEQLGDLPSSAPDIRSMVLEAEQLHHSMHFSAAEVRETHIDVLIDLCVREYRIRAYGYDLTIRAMLYMIVTNIVRLWIRKGFSPQGGASQIDPIYTIPSYVFNHIQDPLKVEDLARFCGLSYPWFARKFHQIYGLSCKDYIEKVRIRKVEQYLLFTDCDLNYISQHTGYSDCSHLVRDFRKFHDSTPIQFRHANKHKAKDLAQFPQNY